MQDSALNPQATAVDPLTIVANAPKHTVVKAKGSEVGSLFSNQPASRRSVHFGPSVGTTPEASQSKARFDGITGLRQEFDEPRDEAQNEPQGGPQDQRLGLQQVLEKLGMDHLPNREEFKEKFQYFHLLGIRDEEHYKRLRVSEKNKERNRKDTERKVRRAVTDALNGEETCTKSTAVKSITDAICSQMEPSSGEIPLVDMIVLKVWRSQPQKKSRPDEETPAVRRVVKDDGKSEDEDMQPTQPTASPDATLSNTNAVYSVSLAAQCFDRAHLSFGATQLNLRCGSGNPLEIFNREQEFLVPLFTRFGNYQCRAQRKGDHVKPEGEHAVDEPWEIVLSPGVRDYACVTVGVTQHLRHGYMDFYIQGTCYVTCFNVILLIAVMGRGRVNLTSPCRCCREQVHHGQLA